MTLDEALAFLAEHQPMPPGREMTRDLTVRFAEVLKCLSAHRDPRCLPLLFGSFGDRGGWGIYDEVANSIAEFPGEMVVPELVQALASPRAWVRHWAGQIASGFPSPCLFQPLARLLSDEDFDCRSAALTALEALRVPEVLPLLQRAVAEERAPDLRDQIRESIRWLSDGGGE